MLLTETTVLGILMPRTDAAGLEAAPGPTAEMVRGHLTVLVGLRHADWMERVASSGFTENDVRNLDDIVSSSLDELALAGELASALRRAEDIDSEAELSLALVRSLDIQRQEALIKAILNADLPDPIVAVAYLMRCITRAVNSALWFERARRARLEEPEPDFAMTDEEIAEGIALAELGLAQDVAEWPPY